jgi:uncharacterized membrane protein YhhN
MHPYRTWDGQIKAIIVINFGALDWTQHKGEIDMLEHTAFTPWATATVIAVMGLLMAEHRKHFRAKAIFKTAAAIGFVGTAVAAGPWGEAWSIWIVVGLGLSLIGDIALLPAGTGRWFYLGIAAFLLAHVAYATAFFCLGINLLWLAATAIVLVPLSLQIYRWLATDVPEKLRRPVGAYIIVISFMVCMGMGAFGDDQTRVLIPPAVLLFLASDIAVAKQRFKEASFRNKLWGLPTYFTAQLLFALLCGSD